MNPVSKSQASSNLIKNMERVKGQQLNVFLISSLFLISIRTSGSLGKKPKENKRKGVASPTDTFAKDRHEKRKNSASWPIKSIKQNLIPKIQIMVPTPILSLTPILKRKK